MSKMALGAAEVMAASSPGTRTHRVVRGAGHNPPQEPPRAFAEAIVEVDRY